MPTAALRTSVAVGCVAIDVERRALQEYRQNTGRRCHRPEKEEPERVDGHSIGFHGPAEQVHVHWIDDREKQQLGN